MVFQIGHQVGDVARSIYDPEGRGVLIDIQELGHEQAFARSAVLLESGEVPVFEAGMVAGGALAYADVMLPDTQDGAVAWKMIEVKSSTGIKDHHRDDIAVQAHTKAFVIDGQQAFVGSAILFIKDPLPSSFQIDGFSIVKIHQNPKGFPYDIFI